MERLSTFFYIRSDAGASRYAFPTKTLGTREINGLVCEVFFVHAVFALVQRIWGINGLVCELFFVHAGAKESETR